MRIETMVGDGVQADEALAVKVSDLLFSKLSEQELRTLGEGPQGAVTWYQVEEGVRQYVAELRNTRESVRYDEAQIAGCRTLIAALERDLVTVQSAAPDDDDEWALGQRQSSIRQDLFRTRENLAEYERDLAVTKKHLAEIGAR